MVKGDVKGRFLDGVVSHLNLYCIHAQVVPTGFIVMTMMSKIPILDN